MNQPHHTSDFLKTFSTNWRDVLHFIFFGLFLAAASGLVDYVSTRYVDDTFFHLILPPLVNFLKGISRFYGAVFCATFLWMLLWPTVNHFGNHRFRNAWDGLTAAQQFLTYVGLIAVALLTAAICFASV